MLTGLSIGDGPDVPYDSGKYQFEYVRERIFPDIQDVTLCPKASSWVSNSITIKYLSSYFLEDKLVAAENDSTLAYRVAIAFFMYVLGHFFFSNAKTYIDAGWLAAFENLDVVSTYDWGGADFSRLYASLRLNGRRQKALCGSFQILEFWGYEYLGICRPDISKGSTEQKWPVTSKWNVPKNTNDIFRCRDLLSKLIAEEVTWRPWESYREVLSSDMGCTASRLSDSRYIFSYMGIHNMYLGERCWRQNHYTFVVPIKLHTVIGDIGSIQAERLKMKVCSMLQR
ncbi:protein MAIN-LIKE 2-like isoform X2 [Papaver somniferum]|uniref:protein MAIN-LIKE 2-like isoform X2 n=1 Tax=Papaver somniferum TaxID=3469 RepID=UPI000E6FC28C|nr:protein MAIN-LIKE 2-like isoform X2 [Papaver somniferum]